MVYGRVDKLIDRMIGTLYVLAAGYLHHWYSLLKRCLKVKTYSRTKLPHLWFSDAH